MRDGAATERDAEEVVKDGGDFAAGQAHVFVELDDGGLGVGPHLASGGAGCCPLLLIGMGMKCYDPNS